MTKDEGEAAFDVWFPQLEIAGLRLVFRQVGEYVKVTEAHSGTWVANVFHFHRSNGAIVRPSYAYREQLGRDDHDRHGIENRRAIRDFATKFYKD